MNCARAYVSGVKDKCAANHHPVMGSPSLPSEGVMLAEGPLCRNQNKSMDAFGGLELRTRTARSPSPDCYYRQGTWRHRR